MPKRIISAEHVWGGAAIVRLDPKNASKAVLRGYVDCDVDTRFQVLEVYCLQCRRPYDAVADRPCEAAEVKGNDALIGGPTGERRKRIHSHHDCERYGCQPDLKKLRHDVGAEVDDDGYRTGT
jgi:hypothetical protein